MVPSTAVVVLMFFILLIKEVRLISKTKIIKELVILLVILLSTVELLRFAWKNTPFSEKRFLFPSTQTIDFLRNQEQPFRIAGSGIPMNYFMQYGISSAEGYDSIYSAKTAEWFSIVNYGDINHLTRRYGEIIKYTSPLIDSANIKYVIDYQVQPKSRPLELLPTDDLVSIAP